MSLTARIRRALTGPEIDADGWFVRGGAPFPEPEMDLSAVADATDVDLDVAWQQLDRDRRNAHLGTALPCARWRRACEHEPHVWDSDGAVAQCPGWRGEP